ncbi:uncharacterized protein GGS22DRAFT_124765 [Annulohypoxylon maeteangense]|uniref:uncharacterized protein n=1 Tax=Annulohypoxylon maeteangense TaxID=1927788 RepID=UPI002007B6ED|nr:uncharacterized protein GGS22DRAFT_124765 [Annulohypoxylon maeteangense]KAI0886136.1 hypothetical protein GGS22DRAFT_124765 [Annulohypoxylon maeteangense]
MKDGWRVVRINPNLGKTKGAKAQKPRKSRRAGPEKANPVAAGSLENQAEQQAPVIDEPAVEPSTPQRVASSLVIDEQPTVQPSTPVLVSTSPIVGSTPTPKPSTVCSPSTQIPFRNPDLNDQPLHWSPRMFKSEIDRHNWTWSEWDSPSQTIEEVTYESEDWPIHDPFARYPPEIRQRLRDVLAMKPELTPSSDSAEGFSPIEFHYNGFGIEKVGSSAQNDDGKSEDLSSWVLINDHPWSPTLLQMWIDSEKDRDRQAARRKEFQLNDDTSTVSSLDTVDFLAEIHCPEQNRPEPSHLEPNSSGSNRSRSVNISSLLQLYIDSDNDRQRWEAEDKDARVSSPKSIPDSMPSRPDAPTPSASRPDESIPSAPASVQDVPSAPASVQDVPTLPEYVSEAPVISPEPTPETTSPAPVPDASTLPQSEEEFSSWVDLDTRKWTDLTFRFHTRQEEGRRMGLYDNDSDDSDSVDSDFSDSFDITGHLQKNYGITVASQKHFRALQEAQQPSVGTQPAAVSTSSTVSPSFTARRQLPSATVMEPRPSLEESFRGSGFGWKSLACVAVTAAAVGAGLAYAWFSG